MRPSNVCLSFLTLVVCIGLTGCGKIPTWDELTGKAPPAKTEPEPVAQPAPTPPPKPPEPSAEEVLAKFKALKPAELNDSRIQQLLKLNEGLESIYQIDATGGMVSSSGLVGIERLPNLKELDLTGTKIQDDVYSVVAKSQSIERLTLSRTEIKGNGIIALQSLRSLRYLTLTGCKIHEGMWQEIGSLGQIEGLGLDQTDVTNAAMEFICQSSSLQRLSIHHTGVTDEGLVYLQHAEKLEVLDLGGLHITGEGLAFLANSKSGNKGLNSLKFLSLAENKTLTRNGAKLILMLRSLEHLNMSGVWGVDDVYLTQMFGSLRNLQYIGLSGAGQPGAITDKGLAGLGNLKNLTTVFLESINTVSDVTLGNLAKCKELSEVHIDGACTILGAQKFKKMRPDCLLVVKGVKY